MNESTKPDEALQKLRDEIDALRRRLAQAEADAVFAEAMENSSEAIVIYDADGLLVACNQNFRDLYGYSTEEAKQGVHFAELGRIDVERGNVVVGDSFGGGNDYLERKAKYRSKLQGSFVVQMKDGRWIKTVDRRMQRGGFVSVQVDITDMKKNEQDLIAAKEAAEKAVQFKSGFLANISHDLRTPLNAIIGFSDMILTETMGPLGHDVYKDYVVDIKGSGELLLSIVDDILDTAKLESGKIRLKREKFDAIECSRMIVKRLAPITAQKGLTVKIEKEDAFPGSIRTDQRAMIQILNNLISNAARHSDDQATITIRWSKPDANRVAVSVRDTGSGMLPEIVDKIGEPFLQKGPYVLNPGTKGAGLGMYICKKLLTAMGGQMDVETEISRGTCVTMQWPDDYTGFGFSV